MTCSIILNKLHVFIKVSFRRRDYKMAQTTEINKERHRDRDRLIAN